jgi:hypothetical protein
MAVFLPFGALSLLGPDRFLLPQHIDPYPGKPTACEPDLGSRRPAQVDQPPVTGVHFVIDLDDNRSFIAKVGHPDPGMHGQRIAGSSKTILAKDLIRISLAPFKFIGVITGYPILHLYRLPPAGFGLRSLLRSFPRDRIPQRRSFVAKNGHREQKTGKQAVSYPL